MSVEPTTEKRLHEAPEPFSSVRDAGRRAGLLGRLRPANGKPAPGHAPEPAPLLPPEAPLEMPEQDLS